jgi:cytochrome c oxidase subunit 3
MLRRSAADWVGLAAPLPMWIGTAALVLSSVALERARRRLRGWDLAGARALLGLTGLLGALFLAGQLVSWRALAAQGVFLATHAHASFFYVLTGVHAVHVLGGAAWYAAVQVRLRRLTLVPGEDGLRLFATYWHFLGALWLYLVWLLFAF